MKLNEATEEEIFYAYPATPFLPPFHIYQEEILKSYPH